MNDMTVDLLAQSRAYGTTDERVVLALEAIADQLRSLAALVTQVEVSRKGSDAATVAGFVTPGEGARENEGGSHDKGAGASFGIKHSVTDQFETSGYRYTKMADAIVEAKRARARSNS